MFYTTSILVEDLNRQHTSGDYSAMMVTINAMYYFTNRPFPTFKEDNVSLTVLLDGKVEGVYLKNNPNGVENASKWLQQEPGNFDENVKKACTRFFTGYTDHDELIEFIIHHTQATDVYFNYRTDGTLVVSAVVNHGTNDDGNDIEEYLFDIQF